MTTPSPTDIAAQDLRRSVDKRFQLSVRTTFMGYIARLYDGNTWVRTINVNGSDGLAYDGFKEYPDVFTAANAITAEYLRDGASREAYIQGKLNRFAA